MKLKQIDWKYIFLSSLATTIVMIIYIFFTNQFSWWTTLISILIFPIIGIIFSFSKPQIKKTKGCLYHKTQEMKNDYFEGLYNFKDIDPIFFIEQSSDLLEDELEQFATWIFDKKYKDNGLIKQGNVISKLPDDQKYYITLIAHLNTELIAQKIITPIQKSQIEKYMLRNLFTSMNSSDEKI